MKHSRIVAAGLMGTAVFSAMFMAAATARPSTPVAQPTAPSAVPVSDVSDALERIRAARDIPAIAAVAVRSGAVAPGNPSGAIARGVAGVRANGSPAEVTTSDLWHIGSCTKAMTATLCALLVDEGKLRWDSTIAEVFAAHLEQIPEHYRPITLDQLLRHSSGLQANLPMDATFAMLQKSRATPTRDREMAFHIAMKQSPASKPGEKFLYSNVGYMIAGHMAELVGDKPYEDLMQERLFKPLGMTTAGFGPPGKPGKLDQPRGHRGGSAIEPGPDADNPRAYAPAGTAHCSMDDWAKFVLLSLSDKPSAAVPLSVESRTRLRTPSPATVAGSGGYAMGWLTARRPWAGKGGNSDGPVLTHGGSNTMWFCVVWAAPEADLAVLAACNAAGPGAQAATDEACAMLIGLASKQAKAEPATK